MLAQLNTPKIRTEHLERPALIYVRQSTLRQVRFNTGSTARQYDLYQRALDLGWSKEQITVVDQDQAQSGTSAVGRDGFQFLIAEVSLGRAGAILSLEAARLARSSSDWHRLIEICALTNTVVIDEDGVYDPGQYNDRLLLGLKATLSETELHWLHNRLQGGKLKKAHLGQLRFRLPTGLVYDAAGQIIFDPDEQVQQVVRLVFELFDQLTSARAVVKHFAEHQLLFPTRFWGGVRDGELVWRPLRHSRVTTILRNPLYTGAYVYGRTKTRTQLRPGEIPRRTGRTRRIKPEEWPVVLKDAFPGYITWDHFLRNQQRLDDNRTFDPQARRGAVREGTALLQGIVLCGRCGRRMSVHYGADRTTPYYLCDQMHRQLAGKTCQFTQGSGIDAAVTELFLAAMQPAHLEVSMTALEQLEAHAHQIERQWQLRLERVQYEADLAQRRFMAVEPENRLVARALERDWNDKLAEVQRLAHEYAAWPKPTALLISAQERQRILALAQDLPTIWHAETTTHVERKQLLRFLIKDVTLTRQETTIHIGVRWQSGVLTELEIPRPGHRTNPAVVERVRELVLTHTDEQIATILNEAGFTTGKKLPFTASRVQWVRQAYSIPTGYTKRQRADGRYSTRAAAELLNVTPSTIARWCQLGHLDALQLKPDGPLWIKLTPEDIATWRKPVRQHRGEQPSS